MQFAGRQRVTERLDRIMGSGKPELIAVVGRRRVGKTYLIRHYFRPSMCFDLTGSRDAPLKEQLRNFAFALGGQIAVQPEIPKDWTTAFQMLVKYLEPLMKKKGRKTIFFDELPWLARQNSRFLSAFEFFWNQWAVKQSNLVVVICGSSAAWMINKILNNRGGLHNRVTQRIHLKPFSLAETQEYLQLQKIDYTPSQIAELYMMTGGIPYYLSLIQRGLSVPQVIQSLVFDTDAALKYEYEELYASLFDNYERHLQIIEALASKATGLTRNELIKATSFKSGGNISTVLNELEASSFILKTVPFGRNQRDVIYRLMDEFSLFYLRWVKKKRVTDWAKIQATPAWQAWSGYAFENLCWRHIEQIKSALGISGVECDVSAWRYQAKNPDETGAQIDLLIHRKDQMINLCELKWSDTEYRISKSYAANLKQKRDVFRRMTKTKCGILVTLITQEGVAKNAYQSEMVDAEVTLDKLFLP